MFHLMLGDMHLVLEEDMGGFDQLVYDLVRVLILDLDERFRFRDCRNYNDRDEDHIVEDLFN